MMKRSLLIMGLVLGLFLQAGWNPARAQELSGANKAYGDLVEGVVRKYGVTDNYLDRSRNYEYPKASKGLYYAELVDLNADGQDELILIYNAEGGYYSVVCEVWEYRDEKASLAYSNINNYQGYISYEPFIDAGGNRGELGYFNRGTEKNFYVRQYMGTGANDMVWDIIFSWKDGALIKTIYVENHSYAEGEGVYYYYINEEEVSKGEFTSAYGKYDNNKRTIILSDEEENYRKEKFSYPAFKKELSKGSGSIKAGSSRARVYLDARRLEDEAIILEGRSLVPVRNLMEALGARVSWRPESKTIEISREDKTILMEIGSDQVRVNGEVYRIDQPAQLIDSKTYIPVRFMAQALGYDVEWDGVGKIIKITSR